MVIPPGGSSYIDIDFKTGKYTGKVTKKVRIICSDSTNANFNLKITCKIDNPHQKLITDPPIADFDTVLMDTKKEIKLTLKNTDVKPHKLEVIDKPNENFIKIDIDDKKLNSNDSTELVFKLSDKADVGIFLTGLTIQGEGDSDSRITIPIQGEVVAPAVKATERASQ
ncbi:MAG: hypothetical protein GF315_03760 [candidate division Zixibacteria bacterium]|nr:hypothetical protein [candidate division Zixibacteria bacterium]